MEWIDNRIQIVPPKRPKKLTATRFATVLGLNPWSTPFEVWCEITRTYQKTFEDTIYTRAGKIIEPKQAEYMKNTYFMSNLVTPITSKEPSVTSSLMWLSSAVCGTTCCAIRPASPWLSLK